MTRKRALWVGGTAIAFLGVALVRMLAPEIPGVVGTVISATGYILVVAGITVISLAMRRRPEDAFVLVDKPKGRRQT